MLSGADFDAFCLDYHPEVYRRLDGTGDLRIKQNLLLVLIEPDELLANLRHAHPKKVERLWNKDETLRERRNRELAARLEQLLKDRKTVLSWTEDSKRIDAEIQKAQTALRHGPSLHAGEVLSDKYQLARQLGTGTFAEVWQSKVLDAADGKTVALKILHGRWCKDEAFVHRFGIGAKILAQLSHPHIVKLIEPATESQGFHYLAMEYLAGGDLYQAVLNDKSGQHRERWIRAVLDVGKALDYAYGLIPKLVHRDVKPHNILLDEQGRGKLCDFDLVLDPTAVRGTQTAQGFGTPDFSAPEQARNAAAVDQRADVYSLAQTMLFVLHSQSFTEGRDPQISILDRIEPTSAVREVLRRATEYSQAKRTSTVAEFCAALEAALQVKESPAVFAPATRRDIEDEERRKREEEEAKIRAAEDKDRQEREEKERLAREEKFLIDEAERRAQVEADAHIEEARRIEETQERVKKERLAREREERIRIHEARRLKEAHEREEIERLAREGKFRILEAEHRAHVEAYAHIKESQERIKKQLPYKLLAGVAAAILVVTMIVIGVIITKRLEEKRLIQVQLVEQRKQERERAAAEERRIEEELTKKMQAIKDLTNRLDANQKEFERKKAEEDTKEAERKKAEENTKKAAAPKSSGSRKGSKGGKGQGDDGKKGDGTSPDDFVL